MIDRHDREPSFVDLFQLQVSEVHRRPVEYDQCQIHMPDFRMSAVKQNDMSITFKAGPCCIHICGALIEASLQLLQLSYRDIDQAASMPGLEKIAEGNLSSIFVFRAYGKLLRRTYRDIHKQGTLFTFLLVQSYHRC